MSDFYCPVCNVRRVSREGEICSSCQDPYDPVSMPSTSQPPVIQFPTNTSSQSSDDDAYVPVSRSNRRIIGAQNPPSSSGNSRQILPNNSQQAANTSSQSVQAPVQSAPIQSPSMAVPVASAPNGNNASQQASSSTISPMTEGIVKNVSNGKDQAGVISRWLRSLFMGIPFAMTDDITEFQVYSNWSGTSSGGGFSADKVVAYGNIVTGKPIQDNSVRVYGKRDKNRMIVATDIENTTDGTYSVFDPKPMSATAVRVITLSIFAIVFLLIWAIGSGLSGLATGVSGFSFGPGLQSIITAIICAVVAFISGKRAVANFGNNWRNCGICALIALVFAYMTVSFLTGAA